MVDELKSYGGPVGRSAVAHGDMESFRWDDVTRLDHSRSYVGRTAQVITALIALVLACAGCAASRPAVLWSFESAVVSPDGSSIEIEVFGVPDVTCFEFDRVETAESGDDLIVSLFYLGPEEGQFCSIPCPLGTGTLVLPLETPRDPTLQVVKDPATEPHCSESLRPNSG